MRKILLVLVAFLLVFAMAGCNDGNLKNPLLTPGDMHFVPPGSGGGGGPSDGPREYYPEGYVFDFAAGGKTITPTYNQYATDGPNGKTQHQWSGSVNLPSGIIVPGCKFNIAMVFTPSRNFKDFNVFFVWDSAPPNGWDWESWTTQPKYTDSYTSGAKVTLAIPLTTIASTNAQTIDVSKLKFVIQTDDTSTTLTGGEDTPLNLVFESLVIALLPE